MNNIKRILMTILRNTMTSYTHINNKEHTNKQNNTKERHILIKTNTNNHKHSDT